MPRSAFGSVMHTTIKRFLGQLKKGTKLPFEEVQRIYETEWSSAGYEDEYQEAEYKKDGLEQLKAFHASMIAEPPNILEQEKAFELPLENDVILVGRMDQVNSLGRSNVEIVDYKTGKPRKEADAQKSLQLSIYALAAREIFEWNPVRLVFHYLQNNSILVTARDSKQIDDAEKIVQETAADIRAKQFPAETGIRLPQLRLYSDLPGPRRIPDRQFRLTRRLRDWQSVLPTKKAPRRDRSASRSKFVGGRTTSSSSSSGPFFAGFFAFFAIYLFLLTIVARARSAYRRQPRRVTPVYERACQVSRRFRDSSAGFPNYFGGALANVPP